MARKAKEYTIEELNMRRIEVLVRRTWINATRGNVAYLRNVAKLCRSAGDGKKGAHTRLAKLLDETLPNHVVQRLMSPLATFAMKSALERLRFSRNFAGEFDMCAMCIEDAADHLNVARRIEDGATPNAVYNMLWRMDTASRDEMHPKVWKWVEVSFVA